ncbi:TIGR04255 family protein [Rhizobium sp. TRM95111]|uniref:TIGR04255 family protein n=1 Tax=Rhizobium alarense TaxID=2846851 RepID=UPI001F488415|nr:TIGR04255 family protein [Rhizobium alarense]MCF3638850.1 TIGR04255 family protein [Rhizobium alarense]
MTKTFDPLFGDFIEHVPLKSAPLVKVLAQVRFPDVTVNPDREFISGFQKAIRKTYPQFVEEATQNIAIGPNGINVTPSVVWRFIDATSMWRVSVTPTFLSLETRKYQSGADFASRFKQLLMNLGETIAPSHVSRIGIRYVDQVEATDGLDVNELLEPHMVEIASRLSNVRHMISEVEAPSKEGSVLARWGHLPSQGSHDPEIMPPVNNPSWFLDVDSFSSYESNLLDYDPEKVSAITHDLANRAYNLFRWCVNDHFLEKFGKGA